MSITGKEWNLPEYAASVRPLSGVEFMIYLRHHGFPSPLLDWTQSPYVAAFFAFRSPKVPIDGKVAIYLYIEETGEAKGYFSSSPRVRGLGHYVESHKRHYAQQCEYTYCLTILDDGRLQYTSHESAFADKTADQGVLRKYILPHSQREEVLKQLHRMNVTSFSLFGNEEGLMETLAFQEIENIIEPQTQLSTLPLLRNE